MKLISLPEFLKLKLKEMYNADNQALKFYNKSIKYVSDRILKEELEKNIIMLKDNMSRISKACRLLKVKPTGKKSLVIESLIVETRDVILNTKEQKIIHTSILSSLHQYQEFTKQLSEIIKSTARDLREIEILKLYDLNPVTDSEFSIIKKDINKRAVHG
jgi:ferritin-like metal-binding protein YciE